MKVHFHRHAIADVAEIIAYVSERDPNAAAKLGVRFEEAAKLIGATPAIGRRVKRTNFRRFVVGNYLMVYQIAGDEMTIHYVRHGARRQPWESE